ncbi:microcystin degradation protein MlrC [Rubrobacter marinus]|uniref:Microcystin degradation protein MlrC n=1 Tax=Rubrobacter marinus TaxID=2653852 RepID=A0A6G8PWE0_9ACTN|nr:M81 family metallopeptidase [Rubrobacter marinus]QIN78467.1 microcystin degradation protein MlrC [Rubrobacter marinus]
MTRLYTQPRDDTGARLRVLLAGLVHQTNTFADGQTNLGDFEVRRGQDMLRVEDAASSIAGVLEVAQAKGWELLPVVDLRAPSSATVADAVVELFWAEFRAVADAETDEGVDGVFLVLHGAMVSESLNDVEGEVLRRIRGIDHLSDAPVCGVFDLHANFTEAMARQSDGLISYRRSLGTDAKQAAEDAALLLDGLMRTEHRPTTLWEHPPLMWLPSTVDTGSLPMRALEERARRIEAELPSTPAVNVLAGFPYADVPEAGVSFSAVTDGDLELARATLRELNVVASSLREASTPTLSALEEAMARLDSHDEGPVLLIESSDNVGAGAPGDGTQVLRALVEHDVPKAGVIINDPESVVTLEDADPGGRHALVIGGKSGGDWAEPLPLEVEVLSRSHGRFEAEIREGTLAGSSSREIHMGPCALVRHGGVTILLTSRRTPPFDLAQWRSQGVDPEDLFVIAVKAATEHRLAYGPIAKASYILDLPGPCAENLERLPFESVSRPIYPLDKL